MMRYRLYQFFQSTKGILFGGVTGILLSLIYVFFFFDEFKLQNKEAYYTVAAVCSTITIVWTISIFYISQIEKQESKKDQIFNLFFTEKFFTPQCIDPFRDFIALQVKGMNDIRSSIAVDKIKDHSGVVDKFFHTSRQRLENYKKGVMFVRDIDIAVHEQISDILDIAETSCAEFSSSIKEFTSINIPSYLYIDYESKMYFCSKSFFILISKNYESLSRKAKAS